jgi:hypothetical protein
LLKFRAGLLDDANRGGSCIGMSLAASLVMDEMASLDLNAKLARLVKLVRCDADRSSEAA